MIVKRPGNLMLLPTNWRHNEETTRHRRRTGGTMTKEMDYRTAYLEIAQVMYSRFPVCEITTVDMVRMLAF